MFVDNNRSIKRNFGISKIECQAQDQNTERWRDSFAFPLLVSQLSPLTFQVRPDLRTNGGEVAGTLSSCTHTNTIGVIAKK